MKATKPNVQRGLWQDQYTVELNDAGTIAPIAVMQQCNTSNSIA